MGGASPSPTEIERDPFVCAKSKDSANNDAGRRGRRPLQSLWVTVRLCAAERRCEQCYGRPMVASTNEIPLNTVGATIGRPHKINGVNKHYGGAPTPTHIVGTGVLDCPSWEKFTFVSKRTMRQLVARTPCPYRGLNDFRSFVRSRKIERT